VVGSGQPRTTDIDEHLERFLTGKYNWKRFAIINFAMKKNEIVLPRNSTYHENVYTYVHGMNTLYRGKVAIERPAVHGLECPGTLDALIAASAKDQENAAKKSKKISNKGKNSKRRKK